MDEQQKKRGERKPLECVKDPRVSVIATFYNAMEYVATCVTSLIAQTYDDYEIILVDDGSTDGTYHALQQYSIIPIVRVFTKQNGGAGSARNFGVNRAQGQYITFVDGDDYVSSRYLEHLVAAIEESNCDLVTAGFFVVNSSECPFAEIDCGSGLRCISQAEAATELMYRGIEEAPWGKIASRSLYIEHPFPEGRKYEDVAIAATHYLSCQQIGVLEEPVYAYCMHENSVVHKKHACVSQAWDFLAAINNCFSVIDNEYPECAGAEAYWLSIWYSRLHTLLSNVDDKPDEARELDAFVIGEVRALSEIVKRDSRVSKTDKLRIMLLSRSPLLYDELFRIYERIARGIKR